MPSSIIGGRLPNGKYKEVSLDASGRLECSVNEIEITADSINVKTQNVENLLNGGLPSALTGSGNLKVCLQELGNEGSERLNVDIGNDITDVLPTALTGSGNLKVSIQEQHGVNLATSTLQGAGLPSALTGSGNLKVSIEEGSSGGDASASNQATMITDLGLIKTSLQSLDDIVQGEDASHGNAHKGVMSLAVRQDTQADFGGDGDYCPMSIDANGDLRVKIDDASKTHLSEIESAVETIEACVGSNKVNVNISSGNISGFATESTLGDAEAHLGTIDTNIANAEAHLGTIDTNIANAETHLGNIDAGVDVLEACVGSNKVNVNISSGNISGFATESTLGDAEAHLGTIDTNIANAETHLGNIDAGVDVLEACVGSNKVNVNISSGNISGFATESTLGDAEAHLGTIDTNIANAEAHLGVIETKSTDAEAHLGTIDTNIANAETHLGNIDTGVDVLEACVGSNKVNVNISSGNITGFATSTLQGTINTSLGTLETSLTSMEGKQDTQITHLSEIEGAVETLEACVSSNKVSTVNTQNVANGVWINNSAVNSQSFSASLETTGYSKLRLYGVVDQDFSGTPPNMIITGSRTDGGTYTPLANSTDGIDTNSSYISSATIIGVNATIDNPPPFIKLYNLHGSTNFTFTLNYKLSN